ncbi:CCS family citrate carrier protein [Fructobacillus ficulneus]|uniref:CCS family citrate carrier protein n=1 Tax=Fructobacillus ficulneus TaxID=157463 RepID=A0A0K8MHW2_9LACO|nr:CCS family citrate carrier protein [Fructobacillus ficulneus]
MNGQGQLLRVKDGSEVREKKLPAIAYDRLLVGMMVALAFYMVGLLLHYLVPSINSFAFLILVAITAKGLNIVPSYYEDSAVLFGQMIVQTMTKALLAGVGLALLDLSALMQTLTWQLVVCVVVSVVTIALVAGYLGHLVGLYPVEAAVTGGLVNNSMGGTGNVAVLSAANRMNLIAFAQMGNRIGGAIVLVIAGFYIMIF